MTNRVIESKVNPLESGHDLPKNGVDEEVSPMDEYLWIERAMSLQVDIPQNITPHSPSNIIQSARVDDIVEDDLGL